MRILLLGATRGTGRAVAEAAVAAGHTVTAVVRPSSRQAPPAGVEVVSGDATDAALLARIVPGHDAFVVALGEYPHPLVFLPGPQRRRCEAVCSRGTEALLAALPEGARVAVVSAYGVGPTRESAPWYFRFYFWAFLPALFADKEVQEAALRASTADYLIVQPVGLTDRPASGAMLASAEGRIKGATVSRADVAAFILAELEAPGHHRASVAVSG